MLSYLKDPVAIESFQQVLLGRNEIKQRFILLGLARMASLPAVKLLIKQLEKGDNINRSLVSFELYKIAQQNVDPQVAALVQSALKKHRSKENRNK